MSPFPVLIIRFPVVLLETLMQLWEGENVSALQVWSHPVLNPYCMLWRKNTGMCVCWYLCCFTYESYLCSRCGTRAAPGQNCKVTCLNRGRSGCWNVAAVTTGLQMCCCRSEEQIREEDSETLCRETGF